MKSELENLLKIYTEQAADFMPDHYTKDDVEFVLHNIKYFCRLYAEKLINDLKIKQSDKRVHTMILYIREWIFKKSIELEDLNVKKSQVSKVFEIIIPIIYKKLKENQDINLKIENLDPIICKEYFLEVRKIIGDTVADKIFDPDEFYQRLGVDVISLQVGSNLISIADPKRGGNLFPHIQELRTAITDKYGFVLPKIRIMDSLILDENEFAICIRNKLVAKCKVYPGQLAAFTVEWTNEQMTVPETTNFEIDPITKYPIYWIKPEDIRKNYYRKLFSPTQFIIYCLTECFFKYADEIITTIEIFKLSELVKTQSPHYENKFGSELISYADLRRIVVNLQEEKVGIKDIILFFDKMYDYARYNKNTDEISEKIRKSFSWQICKLNSTDENILNCISFSQNWAEKIQNNENEHEFEELKTEIKRKTLNHFTKTGTFPAICCHPEVRLQTYRLLRKYLFNPTVIAFDEITEEYKLNIIDKIN